MRKKRFGLAMGEPPAPFPLNYRHRQEVQRAGGDENHPYMTTKIRKSVCIANQ